MANKEQASCRAHAEQQESIFRPGMLFVKELNSEFVMEDGPGFIKGNAMFPEVDGRLG